MRILILKHPQLRDRYTAFLEQLIINTYSPQGFEIIDEAELSGKMQYAVTGSAIYISTNKSAAFFLQKKLQQLWLQAFVKTNKIDVVIQAQNNYIKQELKPQFLIVEEPAVLEKKKPDFKENTTFIVASALNRQTLIDAGFTKKNVLTITAAAAAVFEPIDWSRKQQVKMVEADGSEYFLVSKKITKLDELLALLKAFSAFKKWQHSSMKLVITGKIILPAGDWQEKMATYKHREDVVFKSGLDKAEYAELLAGAYAFIHLAINDSDVFPLLAAMQSHTPIIAFANKKIQEYADGAVAWAVGNEQENLGQKMIKIYKDETFRSQLITHCGLQSNKYSLANSAEQLQKTMAALAV